MGGYLTACALSLSDADIYELLFVEESEEYSKNLGYPVYIVAYAVGKNEDTREWTVFTMDTDVCTYLYGFYMLPNAAVDMSEIYQNTFSQLSLSDEEQKEEHHTKRRKPYLLAGLALLLPPPCTACGNTEEAIPSQDDPNEGLGDGVSEDTVNDSNGLESIWLGGANNDYGSMEFDIGGNWTLYPSGGVMDDGYLRCEPEQEAIYTYSSPDDSDSHIDMEDDWLYGVAYGYFNYDEGMEYLRHGGDEPDLLEDDVSDRNGRLGGNPDSYQSWDSDLRQRNVSEFKGIQYYDGNFSAEAYIVIDDSGNWSYYQCAPGAEAVEVDYGTFFYSVGEANIHYADSTPISHTHLRAHET